MEEETNLPLSGQDRAAWQLRLELNLRQNPPFSHEELPSIATEEEEARARREEEATANEIAKSIVKKKRRRRLVIGSVTVALAALATTVGSHILSAEASIIAIISESSCHLNHTAANNSSPCHYRTRHPDAQASGSPHIYSH